MDNDETGKCLESINCSICGETKESLTCPMCSVKLCYDCFKYSITMELRDPQCIYCKKKFSIDFILENNETVWLKKVFVPYISNLILEKEKILLPSTIPDYERMKEIDDYKWERKNLPLIKDLKKKFKQEEEYLIKKLERMQKYDELTNKINNLQTNKIGKKIRVTYLYKCPILDCKGFIDTNYKCGICKNTMCQICLVKYDDEHKCDSNDIDFAKIIKNQSKSCPKCYTPIIKSGGCDQMFCTNCATAFSWNTGKIELGVVHNPHYYEWLQKNPISTREIENIACGNINDYYHIFNSTNFIVENSGDNLFIIRKAFQKITHTQNVLLRLVAEDRIKDNLDLRLQYLDNSLDENSWKNKLVKRELHRIKNVAIRNVLETFIVVASDIIRQIASNTKLLNSKTKEYSNLIKYTNKCFDKICIIHGGNINNQILETFIRY